MGKIKMNEITLDAELVGKIYRIGIIVLNELILHKTNIVISMSKNEMFDDDYLITINKHPIVHISNNQIIELENRRIKNE